MGSAGCPVGHQLLLGLDQSAVLAGQAHGLAADFVDHHDDVLLDLAAQHPFDDFHGLGVGDAHALDEGALLADAAQRVIDLRTAAVDHHGFRPTSLSSTTSCAKLRCNRSSVMALPPYFTTMVLP